jgi:large subunit ribosomal protein L22
MNNVDSASAVGRSIRVSPRKLNLVAAMIRGSHVRQALRQLEFSKKRIAKEVMKCVISAAANAENNFGLNMDDLIIKNATVGKSMCLKRFMPRARGKSASIRKPFSNLYITLERTA